MLLIVTLGEAFLTTRGQTDNKGTYQIETCPGEGPRVAGCVAYRVCGCFAWRFALGDSLPNAVRAGRACLPHPVGSVTFGDAAPSLPILLKVNILQIWACCLRNRGAQNES